MSEADQLARRIRVQCRRAGVDPAVVASAIGFDLDYPEGISDSDIESVADFLGNCTDTIRHPAPQPQPEEVIRPADDIFVMRETAARETAGIERRARTLEDMAEELAAERAAIAAEDDEESRRMLAKAIELAFAKNQPRRVDDPAEPAVPDPPALAAAKAARDASRDLVRALTVAVGIPGTPSYVHAARHALAAALKLRDYAKSRVHYLRTAPAMRERYLTLRDATLAQRRIYYQANRQKILERERHRRSSANNHPNAAAMRDRRLARKRAYYQEHRAEILAQRRQRALDARAQQRIT
jgi:hypothetical protein